MELKGRTALVTGAGHRVGRAIALALAGEGMRVAVHHHEAARGAEDTLREITRTGASGATFAADLTRPDAPPRLISAVVDRLGALDVLVNSAAVMQRTPFGEVTADEWDAVLALNLRAPFLLAQAAAPHLRRVRGAIVNVADSSAFETWPGYIPHGVSKSGVVYLTKALARVLAPDVRVCGVAPGTVLLPQGWSEADAEHLRATTPLQRQGEPADVTSAIVFLLKSDYITGETIVVDGGRRIRK